jgi:hypothetical protein
MWEKVGGENKCNDQRKSHLMESKILGRFPPNLAMN